MSACLRLIENSQDGRNQVPRRLLAQLDRYPPRRPLRLVHKINIERVLERRVEWMIKGNICPLKLEPSLPPFAAALDVHFFNNHCAHLESPRDQTLMVSSLCHRPARHFWTGERRFLPSNANL